MWIKKTVIVFGVCVGIGGAFAAMVPTSKLASATVLVYDQQNVAEAIKTAVNTATMLTTEEKQLALQVLNGQALDPSTIATYYASQNSRWKEILSEHHSNTGVLSPKTSTDTFWDSELGSLEDVLDGTKTIASLYTSTQTGLKALDKTNKDAARAAQTTQTQNAALAATTTSALATSNAAVGNLTALQAGNTIAAAKVQAILAGNESLANLTATTAVKNKIELQDRATAFAIDNATTTGLEDFVNNMTDAARTE